MFNPGNEQQQPDVVVGLQVSPQVLTTMVLGVVIMEYLSRDPQRLRETVDELDHTLAANMDLTGMEADKVFTNQVTNSFNEHCLFILHHLMPVAQKVTRI